MAPIAIRIAPGQQTTVDLDQTGSVDLLQGLIDAIEGLVGIAPPLVVFQLLTIALIVVSTYYAAKLLSRLFGRRVARRFRRPSVSRTILRLFRLGVFLFGGILVLNVLGVRLGNIVLSVTVFSAVVGIVLAPLVGTLISGVFVLADEPYEVGDMIEIVDRQRTGFVEDITLRYTKVFTLDNTFLVVPNGSMRDRDVINYSAEDPRTRLKLDVTVTYEGDLDEARTLIERAAASVENVIEGGPDIRIGSARYPAAPTCYVDSFADHGVGLRLRYWVREPYKLLTMRSRVQTAVWERLDEADVEIAYPHSHLVFDDTSGQLQVGLSERTNGHPDDVDGAATMRDADRTAADGDQRTGGRRRGAETGSRETTE